MKENERELVLKRFVDADLKMVESSGLLTSRNNPMDIMSTVGATGTSRCGVLETRVRGAWYRVTVILETDYLSVSLDETCEPIDQTTTLNGTLR